MNTITVIPYSDNKKTGHRVFLRKDRPKSLTLDRFEMDDIIVTEQYIHEHEK